MRLILIIAFLFLTINQSFSQNDSIRYYNLEWEEALKDSAEAYQVGHSNYGKLHGNVTNYYISGKVLMTGNFVNGKAQGEFVWYYENGQKKETGTYWYGNFKIKDTWDSLGNQQVKDGNGNMTFHYMNGLKKSNFNYKDGKPNGDYVRWYINGNKKEEGLYMDGNLININFWDINGNQVVINGNGEYKSLYNNGKIEVVGNYKNGVKQGKWKWYYENGNIKEKGRYIEGKKDGTWIYNYNNGKKWAIDSFENGKLIKYKFYPAKGQKEVIIFDDRFDNNKYRWVEKDNDTIFSKIENGKFIFENKDTLRSHLMWQNIPLNKSANFRISANIKNVKGNESDGSGLVWGLKDASNFFGFNIISSKRIFDIYKYENGKYHSLSRWRFEENICEKYNLEIKKINQSLEFYINEKLVFKTDNQNFFGNNIGFTTYKDMMLEADDLIISVW